MKLLLVDVKCDITGKFNSIVCKKVVVKYDKYKKIQTIQIIQNSTKHIMAEIPITSSFIQISMYEQKMGQLIRLLLDEQGTNRIEQFTPKVEIEGGRIYMSATKNINYMMNEKRLFVFDT